MVFQVVMRVYYKPTPRFHIFYFVFYIRLICEYIRYVIISLCNFVLFWKIIKISLDKLTSRSQQLAIGR